MYKNPRYYWKFDEMCTTMKRFFTTLFFAVIACGFNTGAMGVGVPQGCESVITESFFNANAGAYACGVWHGVTIGSCDNCIELNTYVTQVSEYGQQDVVIYDCASCANGNPSPVSDWNVSPTCNSQMTTIGKCGSDGGSTWAGLYPLLGNSIPSSCSPYITGDTGSSLTQGSDDGCSTSGTHRYSGYPTGADNIKLTITTCTACSNGGSPTLTGPYGLAPECTYWIGQCGNGTGIPICAVNYLQSFKAGDPQPSANAMVHNGANCGQKTWYIVTKYGSADTTYAIGNCDWCQSGYEMVADGAFQVESGCVIPQHTCERTSCTSDSSCTDSSKPHCNTSTGNCVECTERSHCPGDSAWQGVPSTMYEKKTVYACSGNSCVSSEIRQCKENYYGDPDNNVECQPCPSNTPLSPAGSTLSSACYRDGCTEESCQASGQHCDTSSGNCVACTEPTHCGSNSTVDDGTYREKVTTYSCESNHTCSSSVTYQCKSGYHGNMNNPTTNSNLMCYICTEHSHCSSGTPVCKNNDCVAGCVRDSHCTDPDKPKCNTNNNQCVGCLDTPDCRHLDDTTWQSDGVGQEKFTTHTCSNSTCLPSTVHRCAANWWGDPDNSVLCNQCPTEGGEGSAVSPSINGQSPAGSTSITNCHLPLGTTGTTYTDDTGTFTYSTGAYCYHQ